MISMIIMIHIIIIIISILLLIIIIISSSYLFYPPPCLGQLLGARAAILRLLLGDRSGICTEIPKPANIERAEP